MRVVVLAGGLGTRLRERVADTPKPMASIAGRPFLAYVLERLPKECISRITLSVGYKWEQIREYFGDDFNGIPLHYAVETEPLGTGGAIVHALEGNIDDPIMVLNGDSLLNLDFTTLVRWYLEDRVPLAMVVRPISDVSRYGSLSIDEGLVTTFHEKGKTGAGIINAGIYCLQPQIFADYHDGDQFSMEKDLLEPKIRTLKIKTWTSNDYFIDIGIPEDYDRAQIELPKLGTSGKTP